MVCTLKTSVCPKCVNFLERQGTIFWWIRGGRRCNLFATHEFFSVSHGRADAVSR
jgi:hypothetical protein